MPKPLTTLSPMDKKGGDVAAYYHDYTSIMNSMYLKGICIIVIPFHSSVQRFLSWNDPSPPLTRALTRTIYSTPDTFLPALLTVWSAGVNSCPVELIG